MLRGGNLSSTYLPVAFAETLPFYLRLFKSYSSSKMQVKRKFHSKFFLNVPSQKQLFLLLSLEILYSSEMLMGFSCKQWKPPDA